MRGGCGMKLIIKVKVRATSLSFTDSMKAFEA